MPKEKSAEVAEAAAPAAPSGPKFKVKKQLTTNVLKMRAGVVHYLKATGPMYEAPVLKNASKSESERKQPTMLPVTDLETSQDYVLICGSVLVDALNEGYPDGSYVGKSFRIALEEKKSSKSDSSRSYNTYNVAEVETE